MAIEILQSLTIRKVPTAENPTGRLAFYHEDIYNPTGNGYLLSNFNIDVEGEYFHPKEEFGAFRRKYLWEGVTVIDEVTGTTYPPSNRATLVGILISIGYTPFLGEIEVVGVQSIVAGTNVTVDDTDPANPIVSASGGTGYNSLQEMYDADVENTKITDGVNTVILDPKNAAVISSLEDGEFAISGVSDLSGAAALNQVSRTGSEVIGNKVVYDSNGNLAELTGKGNLRLQSNGAFDSVLSADNLTASRSNQTPNADGTYGVSVKVNGVSYPFNADGETDDIVAVGGGLTNPLTSDLDLGGNNINNVQDVNANLLTSTNATIGTVNVANVTVTTINGGTLSGNNSGDDATNTTSNAYADGKVIDSIADSDTTHAPSRNAVFDALALKADTSGNVATATSLQTARTIGTITGDATSAGSSFDGTANNTNALTLATVNSNVGTFGNATNTSTVTVNGKGLVIAAANTPIQIAESQVTNLTTDLSALTAAIAAIRIGHVEFKGAPIPVPVDATTYWLSQTNNNVPATASGRTIAAPITATFVNWSLNATQAALVTSEGCTVQIRNVTTGGAAVTLTTAFALTPTATATATLSGTTAFACSQGDKIECTLLTPSWVTNPTNLILNFFLTFQN